jgi:hypothetical protein
MFTHAPFIEAANTPRLHAAFDLLVGHGRWRRPAAMGTFPVRFPSAVDPGDAGWHIDVSFGTDTPDFMSWRANIHSKCRALLMLFLFSDVGEGDAPTRIRVGSHADVARQLAPAGAEGLTLRELAADGFATSADRPVVSATGDAGTGVSVPPIPGACGSAAPGCASAVPGPTAAAARRPGQSSAWRSQCRGPGHGAGSRKTPLRLPLPPAARSPERPADPGGGGLRRGRAPHRRRMSRSSMRRARRGWPLLPVLCTQRPASPVMYPSSDCAEAAPATTRRFVHATREAGGRQTCN